MPFIVAPIGLMVVMVGVVAFMGTPFRLRSEMRGKSMLLDACP